MTARAITLRATVAFKFARAYQRLMCCERAVAGHVRGTSVCAARGSLRYCRARTHAPAIRHVLSELWRADCRTRAASGTIALWGCDRVFGKRRRAQADAKRCARSACREKGLASPSTPQILFRIAVTPPYMLIRDSATGTIVNLSSRGHNPTIGNPSNI